MTKRIDIEHVYIEALQRFTRLVQDHRNSTVSVDDFYAVYSQTGRKYDKVILVAEGEEQILFFIERASGTIYGRKNDIQPNLYWWFNTLYTAHRWNWSAYPYPVDDISVKVTMTYGTDIKHYAPYSTEEINELMVLKTPLIALVGQPTIIDEALDTPEVMQ